MHDNIPWMGWDGIGWDARVIRWRKGAEQQHGFMASTSWLYDVTIENDKLYTWPFIPWLFGM